MNKYYHIALTFVSFLCFYNSLHSHLVHDDIFAIKRNSDLLPETSLSKVFCNDFWGRNIRDLRSHKSYRPLTVLTFRLNYMLHGIEPFGYHLVNLILHALVVNFFFFLLHRSFFTEDLESSFVASVLFATHPVHVEAVTGVVGRADVLSCLLFLVCLHLYIRLLEDHDNGKGFAVSKRFLSVLTLASMCLLIKEHSVMVLGVCLAYDIIQHKCVILSVLSSSLLDVNRNKSLSDANFMVLVPLAKRIGVVLMWLLILFMVRVNIMGNTLPPFQEEDNPASFSEHLSTRFMTYSYLLVFNSQLLLAPSILCYDWQGSSIPLIETILDFRNFYTLVFVSIVVLLVWKGVCTSTRDGDLLLIGISLVFIPFLPASNLFLRVGFVVAERILYISSLGFCMLVALGLSRIKIHFDKVGRSHLKHFINALLVILVSLFVLRTIQYNMSWKSRETLFKSGIDTLPHNAKVHYNYANFLRDENRKEEAIFHYRRAIKLDRKSSFSSHNNLGLLLGCETGEPHFHEAIRITPGHYRAMLNLAQCHYQRNDYHAAEEMLKKCLQFSPDYFDARFLLADVLQQTNDNVGSVLLYETLFSEQPTNADVSRGLAYSLYKAGNRKRSFEIYEKILRENSTDYTTLHEYGKIQGNIGNFNEAVEILKRAISSNAKESAAYDTLGVFYYKRKDLKAAKDAYENLIKFSSASSGQMRNYAIILFEVGERDKAVRIVENLLTANKRYLDGHYTLVNFMVSQGDDEKAEQVIDEALSLFPADQELLIQKAHVCRNKKKYGESKEIYLRLVSMSPENYHALLNVATICHIENEYKEAERYYEKALQIRPRDPILLNNIEKLRRLIAKRKHT